MMDIEEFPTTPEFVAEARARLERECPTLCKLFGKPGEETYDALIGSLIIPGRHKGTARLNLLGRAELSERHLMAQIRGCAPRRKAST